MSSQNKERGPPDIFCSLATPALTSYGFLHAFKTNQALRSIEITVNYSGQTSTCFTLNRSQQRHLVTLSARVYDSPGADFLYHLLVAMKSHINTPFEFNDLALEFKNTSAYGLLDASPELNNALAREESLKITQLRLAWYDVPPQPTALQLRMDLCKLQTLELAHCQNIGYLFNTLLCILRQCQLTVLRVDGSIPGGSHRGYVGKEKLECFLMLHRGIQELTLRDLGSERPSVNSIVAQGATLTVLELHESRPRDKEESDGQWPLLNDHELLQICTSCHRLQTLSINPRPSAISQSSNAAGLIGGISRPVVGRELMSLA